MTLKAAKDIFAKAMKIARQRTLTPTEKKLLAKSQAVIRSHTRTSSANQPPKYYRFDLVKSRGKWFVKDFKTGKLVDGPFDTDEQAAMHLTAWRHSSENPKAVRTAHGTARVKGERGSDYGQPRQTMHGKRFEPGDRVRFKSDKSLGTVTRAGAHSLTVRDDNGDSWQVTTADIIHSSAVKTGYRNPKGTLIYGRCLRIEAIKTTSHTYGGKPTAAGQKYYHDFTSKNAKIYGLPNGDLLISTR